MYKFLLQLVNLTKILAERYCEGSNKDWEFTNNRVISKATLLSLYQFNVKTHIM